MVKELGICKSPILSDGVAHEHHSRRNRSRQCAQVGPMKPASSCPICRSSLPVRLTELFKLGIVGQAVEVRRDERTRLDKELDKQVPSSGWQLEGGRTWLFHHPNRLLLRRTRLSALCITGRYSDCSAHHSSTELAD